MCAFHPGISLVGRNDLEGGYQYMEGWGRDRIQGIDGRPQRLLRMLRSKRNKPSLMTAYQGTSLETAVRFTSLPHAGSLAL